MKPPKCIVSQSWSPEVKVRVAALPLEALGEKLFLAPLLPPGGRRHPLACRRVCPVPRLSPPFVSSHRPPSVCVCGFVRMSPFLIRTLAVLH